MNICLDSCLAMCDKTAPRGRLAVERCCERIDASIDRASARPSAPTAEVDVTRILSMLTQVLYLQSIRLIRTERWRTLAALAPRHAPGLHSFRLLVDA